MQLRLKLILALAGALALALLVALLLQGAFGAGCELADQPPAQALFKAPLFAADNMTVGQAQGWVTFASPHLAAQYLAFQASSVASQTADDGSERLVLLIEADCVSIRLYMQKDEPNTAQRLQVLFKTEPAGALANCTSDSVDNIFSTDGTHYRCLSTLSYSCNLDSSSEVSAAVSFSQLEFELDSSSDGTDYSRPAKDCTNNAVLV